MSGYRSYALALLTILFTFNFADRITLGLVLDSIKVDLHLSDSELGFLSGIAFALFYAVAGIPIARWADRGNRVTIVALTAALWSVMVALCGMAMNFAQLMLIRIGVGVGEAGCVPPAQSLIGDHFSRKELPRAMAIYWQGSNYSLIFAYFVAGWLNEFYGWRITFILVGIPGLVLAALAWVTLKEPRVVRSPVAGAAPSAALSADASEMPATLKEVCFALWANVTFRHLLCAFSIFYFFAYGMMQWQPTFFARSFGVRSGELGTWLAVVCGSSGIAGLYLGGQWAFRFAANNESLQLKAMAIMNVGFNGVIWSLIYLSHNYYVAMFWMALAGLGGGTIIGPMYALPQIVVPTHMRATAIAIVFLFANLIGMGLGPLAVGIVSDALHPLFGQESLRYALLLFTPGYLWVSWHLWIASKTAMRDVEAAVCDGNDSAANQRPTGALRARVATLSN